MNVIQLRSGSLGADPWFVGQARARTSCRPSPASASPDCPRIICLSNAFRAGDASLVVPLDFLRIPLIAVVGWWLYGEPLDLFVFAGAGLIISGPVVEPAQRGAGPQPPIAVPAMALREAGSA